MGLDSILQNSYGSIIIWKVKIKTVSEQWEKSNYSELAFVYDWNIRCGTGSIFNRSSKDQIWRVITG